MLEPILKGLVQWIYTMLIDIMAYASGELIKVMSMDLTYFEQTAPVITTIVDVFVALGWALLIGNMVFQALKSMVSGIGFESEDPKIMFCRSFVFAFLLLSSRQICEMAIAMTGTVINLLQIPTSLDIVTPDESMFSLASSAKWLLVIIVGVILMLQLVKLLFEIGERYVITSVLTYFAPLAFAMGGSKNTMDIFKGWCRMYGSMMVMMIMNIVFLKLILSAMSRMTSGGVLVWLVFIVALARVARKIDSHIGKIGLNPAQTGSAIGSGIPGVMTAVAVRSMTSLISKNINPTSKPGNSNNQKSQRSAGRRTNPFSSGRMGGYNEYAYHNSANTAHQSNSARNNSQTPSEGQQPTAGAHSNQETHTNTGMRQSSTAQGQKADSSHFGAKSVNGKSNTPVSKSTSVRPPINRNTSGNNKSHSQDNIYNVDAKTNNSHEGLSGRNEHSRPHKNRPPLTGNPGVENPAAGGRFNEGDTGFAESNNTNLGSANYQNQQHSAENRPMNNNQRNFRTDNHNNYANDNSSYREQNEHKKSRTDNEHHSSSSGYSGNSRGGKIRKSNPAAANKKTNIPYYKKQYHEYSAEKGKNNKNKKRGENHRKEK